MKKTILFADNEPGIRQFCKQELEAEGFRVVLAIDGEDAVDTLRTVAVDLAILDEHMPRCSGLEAARHIKRWYPHLPVILFTADQDYERYRSPLLDAAVIKSEDLAALKAAVNELLFSGPVAAALSGASQFSGPLAADPECDV
jgi:two-component system response regulator MprA